MIQVTILSPIVGDGTSANPYRPQFTDDYSLDWQDVAGQAMPSDPTVMLISVVTDPSGLQAIQGDARYLVLDSEVINE